MHQNCWAVRRSQLSCLEGSDRPRDVHLALPRVTTKLPVLQNSAEPSQSHISVTMNALHTRTNIAAPQIPKIHTRRSVRFSRRQIASITETECAVDPQRVRIRGLFQLCSQQLVATCTSAAETTKEGGKSAYSLVSLIFLSKIFGGKLTILLPWINLSIHGDGVRCKPLSTIVTTPQPG